MVNMEKFRGTIQRKRRRGFGTVSCDLKMTWKWPMRRNMLVFIIS